MPSSPRADANPYQPPAVAALRPPPPIQSAGRIPWPTFLALGLAAGVAGWLMWSLFFGLAMGFAVGPILRGPGAGFGLFFGPVFAVAMGIAMRPATTTLTITDPATPETDLIARLDAALGKLRYRLQTESAGVRTYQARTLVRPRAFNITAQLKPGALTLTGPWANIKALSRQINAATPL